MAMALFANLVKEKGHNPGEWHIDSAGCWAISGLPATSGAIATMEARNLDLSEHRAKSVRETLLEEFQVILCMEDSHKRSLQSNFPASAENVYLLSEMASSKQEINDPVGSSIDIYQKTANEIERYLIEGFEKILDLS